MENVETVTVTLATLNATLEYLDTRPHREVAGLIAALIKEANAFRATAETESEVVPETEQVNEIVEK